jgi:hypothetical protein
MRNGLFLISLLFLVRCGSTTISKPDTRLGTLVFETDKRPFGRVTLAEHAALSRARIAVASNGDKFILITVDTARKFGTSETATAETIFKKVNAKKEVTSLASPQLGSAVDKVRSFFRVAGDDSSVYLYEAPTLESGTGARAADVGTLAQVHLFDGSKWNSISFLKTDRAPFDFSSTWNVNEDQVRVLSALDVVVQHADFLSRFDGAKWVPVTPPANVSEIRLGTADSTRIRVYWLTTDGTLKTDILKRDGTWVGQVASLKRGMNPKLKGAFGFAGTVDNFTLNFTADSQVYVVRHESQKLTQVVARAPLAGELEGKSFLIATTHPTRQAFLVGTGGALQGQVNGINTGMLGAVPGWINKSPVTCEKMCAVKEGLPVAQEPECAACVPRNIPTVSWAVSPNVDSLEVLFADDAQDATERFYIKSFPLPNANADVTVEPVVSTGAFPGEFGSDAGVIVNDKVEISGTILLPGQTNHSMTQVQLFKNAQLIETVNTSADGTFSLSPADLGMLTVTANHLGFNTQTEIFAAQVGPHSVRWILRSPKATATQFDAAAETLLNQSRLFQRANMKLTQAGTTMAAKVLSAQLTAGDSVRMLAPKTGYPTALLFKENAGLRAINNITGTAATIPTANYENIRVLPQGALAISSGLADGMTPMNFSYVNTSNMVAPLFPMPIVEVAQAGTSSCSSSLVFTQMAPNDIRAIRTGCQFPLVPVAGGGTSMSQVLPMKYLETGITGSGVFGFVGTNCGEEFGFRNGCSLQSVSIGLGGAPIAAPLLSTSAIDARVHFSNVGERMVILESSNQKGTLKVGNVEVKNQIDLPSSYGLGELPVTALTQTSRILIRTANGLFESNGSAGNFNLLLTDVVKVVLADANTAVVWQAGTGRTDCTQGCKLFVVAANAVPKLILERANLNERIAAGGVFSDATLMPCFDGAMCSVITYNNFVTPQPATFYGAGTLFPDVVANPKMFGANQDVFGPGAFVKSSWPNENLVLSP